MTVPIIDVQPRPSLGAAFGQAAGTGLANLLQAHRAEKENKRAWGGLAPLFEELGVSPETAQALRESGISPDLAEKFFGHVQKNKQKEASTGQLSNEEYLDILDQLEDTFKSGKSGMSSWLKSFIPGDIGAESRFEGAKAQSLSTSLLGLAQQVALKSGIRNQKEFDQFLKRTIPNESDTQETALGKIEAMRSYLKKGVSSAQFQDKSPDSKSDMVQMIPPGGGSPKWIPRSQAKKAQEAGGKLVK